MADDFTSFPIPAEDASSAAFDVVYINPQSLLAATEVSRGIGIQWRAWGQLGEFLYSEVAPDDDDYDIVTASGIRLKYTPTNGEYNVDAYGAVGDGVTDDLIPINLAFERAREGVVLRFTAGRTYMLSSFVEGRYGRSLTVIAHGATIKCMDDSVWHVFDLGGDSTSNMAGEVKWIGGILDGNRANQRYWPSLYIMPVQNFWNGNPDPLGGYEVQHTDEGQFGTNDGGATYVTWENVNETDPAAPKHSLADRILTPYTGPIGERFYENSPINGTDWDQGWQNGTGADPNINVRGGGNIGFVRINFAEVGSFEDVTFQNFVRNGAVLWNCVESRMTAIRGYNQLPTAFFEINSFYGTGAECSVMKIGGQSDNLLLGGNWGSRIIVDKCVTTGGALPLFIRTNEEKAPATGNIVSVTNCQFYGISRECWFEIADTVRIDNCDIVCSDYPNSTHRKDACLFISGAARNATVTNCYLYGRINTNEPDLWNQMDFDNCHIVAKYNAAQRVLQCRNLTNSKIESLAGGVLAAYVDNCEFLLEKDFPGSESFRVTTSITNSRLGKERYEFIQDDGEIAEGQSTFQLSGTPSEIQQIQVRNFDYLGGRWWTPSKGKYQLNGDTIEFKDSSEDYLSKGITEIRVQWYTFATDQITTTASLETEYFLTQPGGRRSKDFLIVRYDGADIPQKHEVSDPSVDAYWTVENLENGLCKVVFTNLATIADGLVATLRYNPPLKPYRLLSTGPVARVVDVVGENFEGIVADATTNPLVISGQYTDVSGPSLVLAKDGMKNLILRDIVAERLSGGFIGTSNTTGDIDRLVVTQCDVRDWMIEFARLLLEGQVNTDRAFGPIRSQGTRIMRHLEWTNNRFEVTGKEGSASDDVGRNQGAAFLRGNILTGGNAYFGGSDITPPVINAGGNPLVTIQSFPDAT